MTAIEKNKEISLGEPVEHSRDRSSVYNIGAGEVIMAAGSSAGLPAVTLLKVDPKANLTQEEVVELLKEGGITISFNSIRAINDFNKAVVAALKFVAESSDEDEEDDYDDEA